MAGFRLTDGSSGCPPTATPPSDYEIPFRFDSGGRLWVTDCFRGFHYFGAARHDITTPYILGSGDVPVSTASDIVSGTSVAAGTYETLSITNTTDCTLGILLSIDMFVDLQADAANLARWVCSARWNGASTTTNACSSVRIDGFGGTLVRTQQGASANPHDAVIEAGGAPSMVIASGASATVGCLLFLQYEVGAPTGGEAVFSSFSAVRAYGYVL